ncbi:hypothetical protein HY256_06845 [Candidatus Sumerlaeota bacterium]|nr:hypothetical protein [Candidatus Sumerlaeota bacterium]
MNQTQPKPSRRSQAALILVFAGIAGLVIMTGNFKAIFNLLYNRNTAVIAVVVLVEYVILKGFDRSAQYRRQLEALRTKRNEDLAAIQKLEAKLSELRTMMEKSETDGSPADLARAAKAEIESALSQLRARN